VVGQPQEQRSGNEGVLSAEDWVNDYDGRDSPAMTK
jgi:hypothetical protein